MDGCLGFEIRLLRYFDRTHVRHRGTFPLVFARATVWGATWWTRPTTFVDDPVVEGVELAVGGHGL